MVPTRNDIPRDPVRRQVWIVTTPVKAIGPMRQWFLRLIMRTTGSQLTWAMHWAIEIEGTYFELQRVPEGPKPTLSVSRWTDKKRGIVTSAFARTTTLSNDEIIAKCALQRSVLILDSH